MNKISVIIPIKNEAENIKKVLDSLTNQSVAPHQVIIIDDASMDDTFNIVSSFIKNLNWQLIRRTKSDKRYESIINSMKIASKNLNDDFDYLLILDGDTLLENQYIEKILYAFNQDPQLGISGGDLLDHITKKSFEQPIVYGCNRIYSKDCWNTINKGKILNVNSIAWDYEHSIIAENQGYKVKKFSDIFSYSLRAPSLKVSSFRKGILRYQFGNSFKRILISSLYHMNFIFLVGYLTAYIKKMPMVGDQELIKKLRVDEDTKLMNRIQGV